MDIKNKLAEVGNHFKALMIEGNYELISCDLYTAKVIFEGGYTFELWTGNGLDKFDIYSKDECSGISPYLRFYNEEDRIAAYEMLMPQIKVYKKNIYIKSLERELEQLKSNK